MIQSGDQTGDTSELTKEAENGAPDQEPIDAAPSRSLFFRLQKYGYRKFPSFIPDPELHELLEEYRSHDADYNARSEPPSDEVINLRCIWAVEFYTPSQISKLLRGFEKLGWNTDDCLGVPHDPTLWIKRARESADGGGWFNLGPIQRPDGCRPFGFGRKAPLPTGVEYALAVMYSLTSSITCIVIGFVLTETQNRRFEQALRRERETYITPLQGRGHRIMDPATQKETDIRTLRTEMRELAADWLRAHLPGLFASGILAGEYPTCEFLTLCDALPFPPHKTRDHTKGEWLRFLNIDNEFYTWRAKELLGLKFSWPLTRDIHRFHGVIAAREDDFSDETLQHSSLVYYVNAFVNKMLSRWALVAVLSGFERYLNNVRDSAAFKPNYRARPLHLLEDLVSHVAQSVDISAVSAELQRFAEREELFKRDINVFHPCDSDLYQDKGTTLIEEIRKQTAERAEWLRNIDRSVRDILIQYGTTVGVGENIKLQKHTAHLTWATLALTICIVILTCLTTFMSIKAGNLSWPW